MSTTAKQQALRALVKDLTLVEVARLVDLEVEDVVRLVVTGASKDTDGSAVAFPARGGGATRLDGAANDHDRWGANRARAQASSLRELSPDVLVDRLAEIGGLEGRQRHVARYLLLGESDRGIADRLGCSERTAKRAVADLLARFGVANRASLMLVLFRDAGTV